MSCSSCRGTSALIHPLVSAVNKLAHVPPGTADGHRQSALKARHASCSYGKRNTTRFDLWDLMKGNNKEENIANQKGFVKVGVRQ